MQSIGIPTMENSLILLQGNKISPSGSSDSLVIPRHVSITMRYGCCARCGFAHGSMVNIIRKHSKPFDHWHLLLQTFLVRALPQKWKKCCSDRIPSAPSKIFGKQKSSMRRFLSLLRARGSHSLLITIMKATSGITRSGVPRRSQKTMVPIHAGPPSFMMWGRSKPSSSKNEFDLITMQRSQEKSSEQSSNDCSFPTLALIKSHGSLITT